MPGEAIRQIPFKIGKEAATFSMDRLMARGEWPLTLRSEQFARERKAYGTAVDIALDLMVREATVADRRRGRAGRGERPPGHARQGRAPAREHDDLYLQAKNYLDDLEEVGRMFAIPAVEHVLGAIERYHGTTAGDLLKFMHDQDVRFGVAKTDVERDLYRKLYAALLQQSDLFAASGELAKFEAKPRRRRKPRTRATMTFAEIFSLRGGDQRGAAGFGMGLRRSKVDFEPLEPFPGGGVGGEVVRNVLGRGSRLGPRRVVAVREAPLGGVVSVFPEEREALAPRVAELDHRLQGTVIGLEFLVLCVAGGDLAVKLVRRAGVSAAPPSAAIRPAATRPCSACFRSRWAISWARTNWSSSSLAIRAKSPHDR